MSESRNSRLDRLFPEDPDIAETEVQSLLRGLHPPDSFNKTRALVAAATGAAATAAIVRRLYRGYREGLGIREDE